MVADARGVRDEMFGECGVTAVVMEILLGVGGFNMDRGAELTMVDADIDVQISDVGGGSVPSEVDWDSNCCAPGKQ